MGIFDPPDPTREYSPHPNIPRCSRILVPEAGGWVLQFRDGYGGFEHVYLPSLEAWSTAIADAVTAAITSHAPKSIALDLDHYTEVRQPVPSKT